MKPSCMSCGTPHAHDAEWCQTCGSWLTQDPPQCESHSSEPALGLCVVCGRALCSECVSSSMRRFVCDDPLHKPLASSHTLLEAVASEFEADWIVVNLRHVGIDACQFSANDHLSAHWRPLRLPARVLVPSESLAAARVVLARFAEPTTLELVS